LAHASALSFCCGIGEPLTLGYSIVQRPEVMQPLEVDGSSLDRCEPTFIRRCDWDGLHCLPAWLQWSFSYWRDNLPTNAQAADRHSVSFGIDHSWFDLYVIFRGLPAGGSV